MTIKKIYLGDKNICDILKEKLLLTEDYVDHLLRADDWSMIILAWALLETCLNQAIISRIANSNANEFVDRLPIAGRSGKSSLAHSLGAINKPEKKFLETFAELRNRFVHGVNNFRISFDDFFAKIDNGKSSKYKQALMVSSIPAHQDGAEMTFDDNKREVILANVIILSVNLLCKS